MDSRPGSNEMLAPPLYNASSVSFIIRLTSYEVSRYLSSATEKNTSFVYKKHGKGKTALTMVRLVSLNYMGSVMINSMY